MENVLEQIREADEDALAQIVKAVIRRYEGLFPDWEVVFISLHRNPEKRREELASLLLFLDTHDT